MATRKHNRKQLTKKSNLSYIDWLDQMQRKTLRKSTLHRAINVPRTSSAEDKQLMHSTTSSLQVSATDMSEARSRRARPVVVEIGEKFSSDSSEPVWLDPVTSPVVMAVTVPEDAEAERL